MTKLSKQQKRKRKLKLKHAKKKRQKSRKEAAKLHEANLSQERQSLPGDKVNNFKTSSGYNKQHYVPQWYQKRFLPANQIDKELYYLNLKPDTAIDSRGVTHQKKEWRKLGFRHCFYEDNLYTLYLSSIELKEIEKYFFGRIDHRGRRAVDYFTNFTHPSVDGDAFQDILLYMSTQKLRTPKGLNWLAEKSKSKNKNLVLRQMVRLQGLYGAIWTECIWQIADASKSATKFIVSDHPVTVYNRVCGPRSKWCRGSDDPDILFNGTHTFFPLSLNKILILTNLSWVRNPYQSEIKLRPNPNPFRGAIFKFTDIQTLRYLSEQEVCEINYIIKRRAYRYIAAAKKEWLYPERKIKSKKWNSYGKGYLFMPDPRSVHLGGEIFIGHNDGTSSAFDAYGRRPWQEGYSSDEEVGIERESLYRFKGEFARLFGPYRRGRTFNFMELEKEKDDEEFHEYHLGLEGGKKKN